MLDLAHACTAKEFVLKRSREKCLFVESFAYV